MSPRRFSSAHGTIFLAWAGVLGSLVWTLRGYVISPDRAVALLVVLAAGSALLWHRLLPSRPLWVLLGEGLPRDLVELPPVRGFGKKLALLLICPVDSNLITLSGNARTFYDHRRNRVVLIEAGEERAILLQALDLCGGILFVAAWHWLTQQAVSHVAAGAIGFAVVVIMFAGREMNGLLRNALLGVCSTPVASQNVAEGCEVRISYLLPSSRAFGALGAGDLFGSALYLSPAVQAMGAAVQDYVLAHELGHARLGHNRFRVLTVAVPLSFAVSLGYFVWRGIPYGFLLGAAYLAAWLLARRQGYAMEVDADRFAAGKIGRDRCLAALAALQQRYPVNAPPGWIARLLRGAPTPGERMEYIKSLKG